MDQFYRKLTGKLDVEYVRYELIYILSEQELTIGSWNILNDPILFDQIVDAIRFEDKSIIIKKCNASDFRCVCRKVKKSNNVYVFNNYKLDENCYNDLNNIITYIIIKDGREKLKQSYYKFLLFQKSIIINILVVDIIYHIADIYFSL
jgi:hypothetical protein